MSPPHPCLYDEVQTLTKAFRPPRSGLCWWLQMQLLLPPISMLHPSNTNWWSITLVILLFSPVSLCACCALPEMLPDGSVSSPSFSPAGIYSCYPSRRSPFLPSRSLPWWPQPPLLYGCSFLCSSNLCTHHSRHTYHSALWLCVCPPLQTELLEGRHWDLLSLESPASGPRWLCDKCLMIEWITQ